MMTYLLIKQRQMPPLRRALITIASGGLLSLSGPSSLIQAEPSSSDVSKAAQSEKSASETRSGDQIECDPKATSALITNQVLLHVQGMVCGMCVQGITKLLSKLEGVKSVEIELEMGSVLVTTRSGVRLSDKALIDAVKRAGYRVQDVHRPDQNTATEER